MHAETNKLEFSKILKTLRTYAVSDIAKKRIEALYPIDDSNEIEKLLNETIQAKLIIMRYDQTPMSGVLNIQDSIRKAEIGSVLNVEELLRIVSHQEAVARNKTFIKKVKQLEIESNYLDDYYERIVSLSDLKKAILEVIDQKGEIYDNASSKLSQIRKKKNIIEERIDQKMSSLLRSEATKLTDTLITIRNGRLVLPVKSEYKNSFKGVVHDTSSSGETVFVEPLSCFNMNNELQTLFVEEKAEIERILRELTEKVSEYTDDLTSNFELLTYLDIVFAKAKYAIEYDCHKPFITKDSIKLTNARHPLIPKQEVIGNNIYFNKYKHILITGPNTGGKTVTLKTLGLLSIMNQSGLLIPVDESSETIVFSGIFADIGDEQSIEQSLSTFSSHISNIKHIIDHAKANALILLDEIGSGTDPKEGASLAISIINHLRDINVYSMVTTHYSELKTYAFDLEDTINASVEFDLESLRPTYKLKIGIPGTSNAIQIARRLGLQETIISAAEKVSLSFDNDLSTLIKKLENQSIELEDETNKFTKETIKLKKENEKLEQLYVDEVIKQNNLIKKLESEHLSRLKEKEKSANDLIKKLNELRKNPGFKDHELAKLKHDVKQMNQTDSSYKKVKDTSIKVGDNVLVIPYQRNGIVNKKISNKKYEILMGTLSITLSEKDLEYVSTPKAKKLESITTVKKTSQAKVELDLRGLRYLEAIDELDRFVDTCLINNLEFAYVIHGYGTGALMKGVKEYIKKSSVIKSSRPGGENEGGKGVTVVYFN